MSPLQNGSLRYYYHGICKFVDEQTTEQYQLSAY